MTQFKEHDPMTPDVSENQTSEEELQLLALQQLMTGEAGRSYMWSFLTQCGIFNTVFDKDPGVMAYRAGLRDSARIMDTELQRAAPRLYLLMLEENQSGE
jgi:hypothetical protein